MTDDHKVAGPTSSGDAHVDRYMRLECLKLAREACQGEHHSLVLAAARAFESYVTSDAKPEAK